MHPEGGIVQKRWSPTVRHAASADVAPPLAGKANYGSFVDRKTEELRAAQGRGEGPWQLSNHVEPQRLFARAVVHGTGVAAGMSG
jgi:hypothetical protein